MMGSTQPGKDKPIIPFDLPEDDGLDHLRADVTGTMASANPNDPGYLKKIDSSITALGHIDKMGKSSMSAPPSDIPDTPTDMSSPNSMTMGAPKHTGVMGKIGHVLAKMGNVAGDVFAPELMAVTKGTDLNKRLEANHAAKQKLTQEEATSKENLEGAQADEAHARADSLRHPVPKEGQTPEETTIHDLMTGEQGQPRINPQTQKPYSYLEAYQAVKQAAQDTKPDKTPSFEEQTYQEWKQTHPNGTRLQFDKEHKQDTTTPRAPTEREEWMKDHPGATMDDYWKARGQASGAAKSEASEESAAAAKQYADDYMASGKFTGAGDEALLEKYFELAKPSSGFRMTQPQLEMLQHARDVMGSLEAKAKHMFTPEAPYFSDTQRKQIVETMSSLQKAHEEVKAGKSGSKSGSEKNSPSKEKKADPLGIL